MTTAILVDDEPALLDYLARQLETAWPELQVVGTAVNGREAMALAQAQAPQVAFLDIRMPGLSGLKVAQSLPAETRIVFVTAYDTYAVDAFEAAACDYLLKPVTTERLLRTVERLRAQARVDRGDVERVVERLERARTPRYLNWLRTGYGDTTRLVPVEDVVYFRADQKYTTVVTNTEEHIVRASLKALEVSLDPGRFWRVHRALIVNAHAVSEARRDLRGRYTLKLKDRAETLRTSLAYAHLFKQM